MDNLTNHERKLYARSFGAKKMPPVASLEKIEVQKRLAKKNKTGDMSMNAFAFNVPLLEELMKIPFYLIYNLLYESLWSQWMCKRSYCTLGFLTLSESKSYFKQNWWEAMHGPFADDQQKAAVTAVDTLQAMDAQKVVDCTEDMNLLQSTWTFKLKCFLNGNIKKFKAWYCVSHQQIEGSEFFETYALVVQ